LDDPAAPSSFYELSSVRSSNERFTRASHLIAKTRKQESTKRDSITETRKFRSTEGTQIVLVFNFQLFRVFSLSCFRE